MKNSPHIFSVLLAVIISLVGCSTPVADAPPKHMDRVEFVQYDSVSRPMVSAIEVFDRSPDRKYKVIALITCEGAYHEEVVMTRAINYKAREIGADAIIRLDQSTAQTGGGSMYGFHKGGRSVFRANAIVFEK